MNSYSLSEILRNPEKPYFLEISAKYAAKVNDTVDKNSISSVRKASIQCSLGIGASGSWTLAQLRPILRKKSQS